MSTDAQYATVQEAIDLVTGTFAEPEPDVEARIRARLTGREDPERLIAGLLNLTTILLVRLEQETARPATTELEELRARYRPSAPAQETGTGSSSPDG